MKKTLIALSVAAIATTAQAKVELFADDATNVSLKGNVSASVYKETKEELKNGVVTKAKKDASINNQAKVQFDFSHKVSSDVTVGGTMEIQTKGGLDGTDNGTEFDDVALYAKTSFGTFGVGEIGDVADSNDGVNKSDISNELGAITVPTLSDSNGKNASYSNTFGAFTATADVYTTEKPEEDNSYGLGVNYKADMFEVGAMYQVHGDKKANKVYTQKGKSVLGFGASVTPVDMLTLALDYGIESQDNFRDAQGALVEMKDKDYLASSVTFKATDAVALYATYAKISSDNKLEEGDQYLLGASYDVTSNITLFAEYTEIGSKGSFANKSVDLDTNKAMLGAYVNF